MAIRAILALHWPRDNSKKKSHHHHMQKIACVVVALVTPGLLHQRRWGGTAVIALASHSYIPDLVPRHDIICAFGLLLVLFFIQEVFSRYVGVPSLLNQFLDLILSL